MSGIVTKRTPVRGTVVPTLMLKLIELRDTFGALLDCRTVVRICDFCSVVNDTEALVCELVVEAPACGLVESDDLLACAKREFLEETNLPLKGIFVPLQPVRQKSGKTVHAFAIEADLDLSRSRSNRYQQEWPPGSGKFKSFPEIDRIAYFDLEIARAKILPYQLPYLAELTVILGLPAS